MAKSIPINESLLLLHIQLLGIKKPPVWRRVTIPSGASFYKLHQAIQASFGWENYHLHEFRIASDPPIVITDPRMYDEDFGDGYFFEEKRVKLNAFLKEKGDQMEYIYDFGDHWEHQIKVERVLEGAPFISLVDAQGACPPEDCGGVPGYEYMKKVLASPNHEEHESMLEWLGLERGSDWDAEDASLVDAALRVGKLNIRRKQ